MAVLVKEPNLLCSHTGHGLKWAARGFCKEQQVLSLHKVRAAVVVDSDVP